jgi:hypothetical protein
MSRILLPDQLIEEAGGTYISLQERPIERGEISYSVVFGKSQVAQGVANRYFSEHKGNRERIQKN